MLTVEIKNVHKQYGNVHALRGISFECRKNEFLAILGPSGAGKTSILKMIAGLESITEGEISVDGQSIRSVPSEARNVAMVFETYALYPHLSVFENLAFPLKSKTSRLSREAIDQRVRETAETLQIGHLLDRKPAELSGGQKQRVSLGRALVRKTGLLLMDEPISHLDAKLRHRMRRELKKHHRTLDATVVYVTHDYLEALALADRIVVLNQGKIHQIGTPREVYHDPADLFVASLLGHPRINLIPAGVKKGSGDGLRIVLEGGSAEWPVPGAHDKWTDWCADITVGIRPQHIRLSRRNAESGITGEVYVVENLGVNHLIEVKVGTVVLNVLSRDSEYTIGQNVSVQFPEDRVMLFDRISGKKLRSA